MTTTHEEWSPDELERVFRAAVGRGDAVGVEAALRLLALRDPHRAQRLLDALDGALTIAHAIELEGSR